MTLLTLMLSAFVTFGGTRGDTITIEEAVRLVPRSAIDASLNKTVTVFGIVTVPSARTDGQLQTFIQGRHAGIRLFSFSYQGPSLLAGDSVSATGTLGIYYGQEEILSPQISIIKRGVRVSPINASISQIEAGAYHGLLVSCSGKVIRKAHHSDGVSIYFIDGDGDTTSTYVDYRQDPQFQPGKIAVGSWLTATGIATRFSYHKPYTGDNDILLRSSADIETPPGDFFQRNSKAISLAFAGILLVAILLTVFTYVLRTKVRQKTRQLGDQARILKLLFESIAELTGVLDTRKIMTLALERGHSLTGTETVIFGEIDSGDREVDLTAFTLPGSVLTVKSMRFSRESFSGIIEKLSAADSLWNTSPGSATSDSSLRKFLSDCIEGKVMSVTAPDLRERKFIIVFDHSEPVTGEFLQSLVKSYVHHVYLAYRAAQLFDLARDQRSALETLYNNSVFGLLTLSEAGKIQSANRIALGMFEDEEFIGKNITEYLQPEDAERFGELLKSVGATQKEEFVRFEARINKADERSSVEFAIQYDPAVKVFYATVQDTEDRISYEAFSAKEKSIEMLEKLASSLTHDLNNIIGTVTGYASLLKRKLSQTSKEYHYADIIENSAKRAAELVKEVLGFAQLDARSLDVVDLNRFGADVLDEFGKTGGQRHRLTITPSRRPVITRISTSQIRQVLMSVLTNAAESMPDGGAISCTVGLAEVPQPAPSYIDKVEHCFIEVEDHGLGMDETIQRRVFEPFFTTKRVKKYTGLSLSMAYNIVKHHKGFISVDSVPGSGTKVRIYLPRFSEKSVQEGRPEEIGAADTDGAKILVVDDEEGVRQLATDILTDGGYVVVTASDGRQALECLGQQDDIRLVVLDMVMPQMGGRETCVEIKKMAKPPKVLICTGYSELSDLQIVMGKHADGFLQKPYSTGDMVKAVESLLGAKGQA